MDLPITERKPQMSPLMDAPYGTAKVAEEDDWLAGSQACDLGNEGACESCQ